MKIEPKYKDGEPLCTHGCPACFDDFPNWWKCRIKQSEVDEGEPCIPALRRDRDQATKERDEALTREKALQREICTAKAELIFCDAMIPRDRAIFITKQRGWDCYDTPVKESGLCSGNH